MKLIFEKSRIFFIAIACLNIYACALIQSTPESINKDISLLLSKNEFDEIDDTLKNINKTDNKFKKIISRQKQINKQKASFIEATSKSARAYRNDNKWQLALDTYNNALEKVKTQPLLSKERDKLVQDRDMKVTALKQDMLIKRANALISYKQIYSKLHELVPQDYSAQFDINRYEKDRMKVAGYLKKCGDQARIDNQYIMARNCYSLSTKLVPAKQQSNWVAKIDSQLKNNSDKKRFDELLSAYNSAFQKEEYIKAQLHLNTLLAIDPSHQKAKILLESLNKKLSEQISIKITQGREFYSKKKINDALLIWQQALLLEPDNEELIQLVSRAEKVSKKIQSLEETQ